MAGGVVYLVPDWPWPANTGSRLRTISIVEALQPFGPVTLIAADRPDPAFVEWSAVTTTLQRPRTTPRKLRDHASSILRGRGLVLERALQDDLHRAFAAVIDKRRPAVVVLTPPFVGPFIDAARSSGAVVIASADESLVRSRRSIARSNRLPVGRRVRAALDALAYQRLEQREYPRFDQAWPSNDVDASILANVAGAHGIRVIPNCAPIAARSEPCADEVRAIAYVGSFGHPPNQAAAMELILDIMPAIRAAGGPGRLVLIGRDPTDQMMAAAARDQDTIVTGAVDDIATHLCSAGLLVVPLRSGAGTRIKILEAAALGVPVVSTRFGAEGLGFNDGVEILLAETSAEFADRVVRVAQSPELRTSLVAAAQEAVRSRFSQGAVDAAVASSLTALGLIRRATQGR